MAVGHVGDGGRPRAELAHEVGAGQQVRRERGPLADLPGRVPGRCGPQHQPREVDRQLAPAGDVGTVEVAELALEALVDHLVLLGPGQAGRSSAAVVAVDEPEQRRERAAEVGAQAAPVAHVEDPGELRRGGRRRRGRRGDGGRRSSSSWSASSRSGVRCGNVPPRRPNGGFGTGRIAAALYTDRDGLIRPGDDAGAPGRRAVRRAGDRRWHHRGRDGPRRRQPRSAHRAGRAARLRVRHVVQELQARPRRAALPAAGRRPAGVRGPRRTPAAPSQRAAPGADPPLHDPHPDQGRGDEPQDREGLRLGAVDVRPHRRGPDRQAAPPAQEGRGPRPHADDARRAARLGLPLLRRPDRRCPSLPDRGPDRGCPRRRRAERRHRRRVPQGRRAHRRRPRRGRRAGDRRAGPRRGERRRGVVRRGAGAGRRRAPGLHPAREGRPPHDPVGQGAERHRRRDPGPQGQAEPVRRAVGGVTRTSAPPTRTTAARSTTRSARRRTWPTCCGRSTIR